MELKIGTINLKNDEINRRDGLRLDGENNYEITLNHILEENFDILGTQELTRNFSTYLDFNLDNYVIYGKYRFGNNNIVRKIKLVRRFNESTAIITKYKVIKKYTKHLPFIPIKIKDFIKMFKDKKLCVPRIATIVILKANDQDICVINTHLDYRFKSVQIRELNVLRRLIRKYIKRYKIVLTGDFNMDISSEHFRDFINDLDKLGIKRVEVNDKTNALKYRSKTAIDHIFIPSNYEVLEKGINDLGEVTDHKEIYARVKVK